MLMIIILNSKFLYQVYKYYTHINGYIIKGDKSVGKTSFLDAITNSFGKVVEAEQSEELSIKVNNLKK